MTKNNRLDDVTEDDRDSGINKYSTDKIVPHEDHIPGASLNGKKPCQLTVAQLKC